MKRCMHWWRTGAKDEHGHFHCRECWEKHWNEQRNLPFMVGDRVSTQWGKTVYYFRVQNISISTGPDGEISMNLQGRRLR